MSDPRPRRIAPFVALAVAAVLSVVVFVFAGATRGGDSAATPLMGKPAPAVRGLLTDADGVVTDDTWQLSRQKGDWVVLNFFDSTCAPCVREHPELVRFAEEQAATLGGAELYSIAFGSEARHTRESARWLRDNDATWDVVLDDGSIANAFAVAKVPETWIINPNGFVVARYIREITAAELGDEIAKWSGTVPEVPATTVAG